MLSFGLPFIPFLLEATFLLILMGLQITRPCFPSREVSRSKAREKKCLSRDTAIATSGSPWRRQSSPLFSGITSYTNNVCRQNRWRQKRDEERFKKWEIPEWQYLNAWNQLLKKNTSHFQQHGGVGKHPSPMRTTMAKITRLWNKYHPDSLENPAIWKSDHQGFEEVTFIQMGRRDRGMERWQNGGPTFACGG